MTTERSAVERLLRPRSIALVGLASPDDARKQTHWEIMGMRVLANLERFGRAGDVHLVSRASEINGRRALAKIEDLPDGVDLALLAVPVDEAPDAVRRIAKRGIRAAIVYAGGFAEDGAAAHQEALAEAAREGGVALLGPGTVGLANFADGLSLSYGNHKPAPVGAFGRDRRAVAILSHSGGVSGQTRLALEAQGIAISYAITTGGEAVLRIDDFLDFVTADSVTQVIAIFTEDIRNRAGFARGVRAARAAGKFVILLQAGKNDRAFTDAMAANAGALVVETLEELWDAAEVLVRFGAPPRAGAAILCDGGVRGVLADQSEAVGLPLAKLDSANPTDLSRTGLTDWEQYGRLARTLLNNDAVGSLIISIMPGPPEVGLRNARATLPALKGSGKPVVYTLMGGTSPTAPDLTPEMQAAGVPFRRSPERVVRSMAKLTRFGMRQAAQDGADFHVRIGEAPAPQQTSVSHWSGTQRGSGAPPNKKVVHAALSASPLASDGALLTWTGAPLTDLGGDLEKAGAIVCNFLGVDPTAEDEFNAWYDTEHLPRLCAVPGVLGARRYNSSSHTPRYIALYLLAHAGVADSPAWREAAGTPWTARMRGYTRGFLSFILTRAVV